MKKLLLILLLCLPAFPATDDAYIIVDGPCIEVRWDPADAGTGYMYYSIDSTPATGGWRTDSRAVGGAQSFYTCDLPPNDTIWIQPEINAAVLDCADATTTPCDPDNTKCEFGTVTSDYAICPNGTDPISVETDASFSVTDPTAPSHTLDPPASIRSQMNIGADSGTGFEFTATTITRNDSGNWHQDGYGPGQTITIANAEDAGNNGEFTITDVTDTVLTASGASWTVNGADTTVTFGPWETERTVSCTSNETTNYGTQIGNADSAADSGSADEFHAVYIPAGCRVDPSTGFTDFNNRSVKNIIVTLSDTDRRLFSPYFSRAYKDLILDYGAYWWADEATERDQWIGGGGTVSDYMIQVTNGVSGQRDGYSFALMGLGWDPDAIEDYTHVCTISNIDSTTTLTITVSDCNPDQLSNSRDVVLVNSTNCTGINGPQLVNSVTSTTVTLDGSTTRTVAGTCNAGTLTFSLGSKISSVTNATPPVVTTTEAHGFPEFDQLTVDSMTNPSGTITRINVGTGNNAPDEDGSGGNWGDRYIDEHDGVGGSGDHPQDWIWIEGTGTSLDDGAYLVQTATDDYVEIDTGTAVTCSATCGGTVEKLYVAMLEFDAGLPDCAEGSRVVRVTGSTTFELAAETACGTGSPDNAYVLFDGPDVGGIVSISGQDNMVSIKNYFGMGFPIRGRYPYSAGVNFSGMYMFGNWMDNPAGIRARWPDSDPNAEVSHLDDNGSSGGLARFPGWDDVQVIQNTAPDMTGIGIFSDTGNNSASEDWTVRRNRLYSPYWTVGGQEDEARGEYYFGHRGRHCIEWKGIERISIIGNWLSGCGAPGESNGGAINFSSSIQSNSIGTPRTLQDIRVAYNYVIRSGQFVEVASQPVTGQFKRPSNRIKIEHNLVPLINYRDMGPEPYQGDDEQRDEFMGQFFNWTSTGHSLQITRNTFVYNHGRLGSFFTIGSYNGRSSLWNITDNIIGAYRNQDNVYEGFVLNTGASLTPSCGVSVGMDDMDNDWWECWVARMDTTTEATMDVPDPGSDLDGNIMIPMHEKGAQQDWDDWVTDHSDTGSDTWTDTEASTFYSGWGTQTWISGSAATDRVDTVFQSASSGDIFQAWEPEASYSTKGADIRNLKGALGYLQSLSGGGKVEVRNKTASAADIVYMTAEDETETAEWCALDYTSASDFSSGWWSTGTRMYSKGTAGSEDTFSLTGLSSATTYRYRLFCPMERIEGQFTTN